MSNQVPPGPGQPPQGSEPPYEPYSSQAPGVPPPPGSYPPGGPQSTPPPYGQPSYGSVPSYGPAPQQYGPPSEPSYGPPPGQDQPSYGGYDPAQSGYAPGYQPGQGQMPPGGYVPSYGGPQPGAPSGGSGGKIVAIAAAAVIVVGLVLGGVFLLTRGGDDPDPVATASGSTPSKTSATPKPTTSSPTSTPTPTSSAGEMSWDDAMALAQAAFPPAAGYEFDTCMPWSVEYDADLMVTCDNDVDSDIWFDILVYSDTSSAATALRDDWRGFQESSWERGTDFVSASSGGSYYYVIRCYSDAPVCMEVAASGGKAAAETALSHFSYLDAAGIAALNDRLAGRV